MADAAAPRLGCLIMAAGNASRFGANKLFAAYRGKTFLELALLAVPPQIRTATSPSGRRRCTSCRRFRGLYAADKIRS